MARFERGRRDSGRGRRSFDDEDREFSPRRAFGGRGRRDSGRGRPEMTKVICSSCGKECEVPFKPTSSKPVYCSECFGKKDKRGSEPSSRDLDMINEKLNKIMKHLKID